MNQALKILPLVFSLSTALLHYTHTISFLNSKAPNDLKYLYKRCGFADSNKGGLTTTSVCVPELPSMKIPKASGSLVSLEHVNINVGSNASSFLYVYDFYIEILGCGADTRAPAVLKRTNKARAKERKLEKSHGLLWANVGLQQFHLPADNPVQRFRGVISMAYSQSEYNSIINRLLEQNYKFRVIESGRSGRSSGHFTEGIEVMCPYGNKFHIYPTNTTSWLGPAKHIPTDDEVAKSIQLPGGVTAGLGIEIVDMDVPFGIAEKIGKFYEYYFDAKAEISYVDATEFPQQRRRCVVRVGYNQQIAFTEAIEGVSLEPYDGHHIAVYVNNFVESYYRLSEDELVWNNPRFPQFKYDTIDDALEHNEFRFLYIVDVDTNEKIFEIEHELRSLSHPSFSCRKWLKLED